MRTETEALERFPNFLLCLLFSTLQKSLVQFPVDFAPPVRHEDLFNMPPSNRGGSFVVSAGVCQLAGGGQQKTTWATHLVSIPPRGSADVRTNLDFFGEKLMIPPRPLHSPDTPFEEVLSWENSDVLQEARDDHRETPSHRSTVVGHIPPRLQENPLVSQAPKTRLPSGSPLSKRGRR